jgi:hypothetical protein
LSTSPLSTRRDERPVGAVELVGALRVGVRLEMMPIDAQRVWPSTTPDRRLGAASAACSSVVVAQGVTQRRGVVAQLADLAAALYTMTQDPVDENGPTRSRTLGRDAAQRRSGHRVVGVESVAGRAGSPGLRSRDPRTSRRSSAESAWCTLNITPSPAVATSVSVSDATWAAARRRSRPIAQAASLQRISAALVASRSLRSGGAGGVEQGLDAVAPLPDRLDPGRDPGRTRRVGDQGLQPRHAAQGTVDGLELVRAPVQGPAGRRVTVRAGARRRRPDPRAVPLPRALDPMVGGRPR